MGVMNWIYTIFKILRGNSIVITLEDSKVQYIKVSNISKKEAMIVTLKTAKALSA